MTDSISNPQGRDNTRRPSHPRHLAEGLTSEKCMETWYLFPKQPEKNCQNTTDDQTGGEWKEQTDIVPDNHNITGKTS